MKQNNEYPGLTKEEYLIMDKLIEAHNEYMKLEEQHPMDKPEWVDGLHQLQKLLGMRILRREYPHTFPIHK